MLQEVFEDCIRKGCECYTDCFNDLTISYKKMNQSQTILWMLKPDAGLALGDVLDQYIFWSEELLHRITKIRHFLVYKELHDYVYKGI